MDQPAADAGAAVGMFTGRLEGALQHVSTHTAQKTLIHVTHKPLQIVAHSATTQIDYTNMTKAGTTILVQSHLWLIFLIINSDSNIPTFHLIQLFLLLSFG